MSKKFLILLFLIPFQLMFAQKSLLKDFPEGYTPEEIGKRIAYRFLLNKEYVCIFFFCRLLYILGRLLYIAAFCLIVYI